MFLLGRWLLDCLVFRISPCCLRKRFEWGMTHGNDQPMGMKIIGMECMEQKSVLVHWSVLVSAITLISTEEFLSVHALDLSEILHKYLNACKMQFVALGKQ